jgi:signal transduction histidine kinase
MALFWCLIVAGLLVVCTGQVVAQQPRFLSTANGVITLAIAVSFGLWFLYLMVLRGRWRLPQTVRLSQLQLYLMLGVGIGLSVALVLLHHEYVGLLFADMGIMVFALDGWASVLPVTALGIVFLYATGALRSAATAQLGEELISLVATVGLIYTLAIVMHQRMERDALIAELREAHDELRVAAARDVELAALRERNRLAREMHDSLGHALVLIAIKIEAAQRLQAVDPKRAAAEWEETKALVRSTMSDLRSSLAGLRLPALEEQSFRSALADLVSNLQRSSGIAVTADIPDEVDFLDRAVQEPLYRVAQEALANIARHAHAQDAWLRVTLHEGTAELSVEDDGVGLDAAAPGGSHFGVVGMRERVEVLGGSFILRPRSGGGTALRATVPVEMGADVRDPHPVG